MRVCSNLLVIVIFLPCNVMRTFVRKVEGCIGTKFISRWSDLAVNIALDAVSTVIFEDSGRTEVDIKRYAKVEKIPGGSLEESQILKGVMLNKDVTHPKMKRFIKVCET